MCPVPLSDQEWDDINADLPDVGLVCDRITAWPYSEWIECPDLNLVHQLRVSNVCFRDAAYSLGNAHYALGQAIAVRKYFLAKSTAAKDNDHILADVRSRFYADYVPLLLHAVGEHSCVALLALFDLMTKKEKENLEQKKKWPYEPLRVICKQIKTEQHGQSISKALSDFDCSEARKKVWKYSKDWKHNKPPRVESIFYNPTRDSYIIRRKDDTWPWDMVLMGASTDPDFTWDDLVKMLKDATASTVVFLTACAEEWERKMPQNKQ